MSRNTHSRSDLHRGLDQIRNIVLSAELGPFAAGTDVETVIAYLNSEISNLESSYLRFGYLNAASIVQVVRTSQVTAGAFLNKNVSGSFKSDARVAERFFVNALLAKTVSGSFTAEAWSVGTLTSGFISSDAVFLKTQTGYLTADSAIRSTASNSLIASAALLKTQSGSATASSIVLGSSQHSFSGDSAISKSSVGLLSASASLLKTSSLSMNADAGIDPIWSDWSEIFSNPSTSAGISIDAIVIATVSSNITADSALLIQNQQSFSADSLVLKTSVMTITSDAEIVSSGSEDFQSDAFQSDTFE